MNGVGFADGPHLRDYYRRQVIGGPGAFVLSVVESAAIAMVLRRKFWFEIANLTPP